MGRRVELQAQGSLGLFREWQGKTKILGQLGFFCFFEALLGKMVQQIRLWYTMSWSSLIPSHNSALKQQSDTPTKTPSSQDSCAGDFSDCTFVSFSLVWTSSLLPSRKHNTFLSYSFSSFIKHPPFVYFNAGCSVLRSTGSMIGCSITASPPPPSNTTAEFCFVVFNINQQGFYLLAPVSHLQQAPRSFPTPVAAAASAPPPSGSPDPFGYKGEIKYRW